MRARRASAAIAVGVGLMILACGAATAQESGEKPFLADDALVAAFADATLIAPNWAEYYAPDGVIVGKVKYLGILRSFNGRWIVKHDQVCFEYQRAEYNTCSKFRRVADRMRHFALDGTPKADGESRRLAGNRLDEFR